MLPTSGFLWMRVCHMCGVYEYMYVGVCTHACVQWSDEEVSFPVLLPSALFPSDGVCH